MAKLARPPAKPAKPASSSPAPKGGAGVKPSPTPAATKAPAATRPAPPARKQPATTAAPSRFGGLRERLAGRSLQQAPTSSFFRESLAELRKVHWPTREETTHMTIIVIVFSLATGVFLGGLDWVFAQIITFIVGAR